MKKFLKLLVLPLPEIFYLYIWGLLYLISVQDGAGRLWLQYFWVEKKFTEFSWECWSLVWRSRWETMCRESLFLKTFRQHYYWLYPISPHCCLLVAVNLKKLQNDFDLYWQSWKKNPVYFGVRYTFCDYRRILWTHWFFRQILAWSMGQSALCTVWLTPCILS